MTYKESADFAKVISSFAEGKWVEYFDPGSWNHGSWRKYGHTRTVLLSFGRRADYFRGDLAYRVVEKDGTISHVYKPLGTYVPTETPYLVTTEGRSHHTDVLFKRYMRRLSEGKEVNHFSWYDFNRSNNRPC
jgi:hypothetical protein